MQAPDPILEAIEAHKAAFAKLLSWVDRYCKLESELPEEMRYSDTSRDIIVQTDDPGTGHEWMDSFNKIPYATSLDFNFLR
jgi:hypothetical protein